jgi:Sugar kinases, ribokinase family
MKTLYILGSLNMDLAIYGEKNPGAGETVRGHSFRTGAGGKGLNQAVAARKLGIPVRFLGAIGPDAFGQEMKETLAKAGVDVSDVKTRDGISSGVALIEVVKGENRIMLDLGANETITTAEVDSFLKDAKPGDLFLTEGENNFEATAAALRAAHDKGLVTLLNPAPADQRFVSLLPFVDVLIPNETEFAILFGGANFENAKDLPSVPTLIVTLGKEGSFIQTSTEAFREKAPQVNAIDTTGAGDAYCGALAAFLALGKNVREAAHLAGLYASLKTTKKGTAIAMPTFEEFASFLEATKAS